MSNCYQCKHRVSHRAFPKYRCDLTGETNPVSGTRARVSCAMSRLTPDCAYAPTLIQRLKEVFSWTKRNA